MSVGMQATRDARPIHRVYVDGFWMDATEVTNEQFAEFVEATGYVTVAERTPTRRGFSRRAARELRRRARGLLAARTTPCRSTTICSGGAMRRARTGAIPTGPAARLAGSEQLSRRARRLRGRRGVREVGGQATADRGRMGVRRARRADRQALPWGDEFSRQAAARWPTRHQGHFPDHDAASDGFAGIAPVGAVSAERLRSVRRRRQRLGVGERLVSARLLRGSCVGGRASRATRRARRPLRSRRAGVPKRVHRGGSFLCTDQYCSRYMVGTRGKGEVSTGTNHLGFRAVLAPRGR